MPSLQEKKNDLKRYDKEQNIYTFFSDKSAKSV